MYSGPRLSAHTSQGNLTSHRAGLQAARVVTCGAVASIGIKVGTTLASAAGKFQWELKSVEQEGAKPVGRCGVLGGGGGTIEGSGGVGT